MRDKLASNVLITRRSDGFFLRQASNQNHCSFAANL